MCGKTSHATVPLKSKMTESWNFARAKFLARLAENLAKSWNFWAGQGCSAAVHWGRLCRPHSHGGWTAGGCPRPRQPISCLVQGKGKQKNKQKAAKSHLVWRFMVSVLALFQASKYVFPETQLRYLTPKFYLYMCLARRKLIDERSYENLFSN
jgi:hypothetical protein